MAEFLHHKRTDIWWMIRPNLLSLILRRVMKNCFNDWSYILRSFYYSWNFLPDIFYRLLLQCYLIKREELFFFRMKTWTEKKPRLRYQPARLFPCWEIHKNDTIFYNLLYLPRIENHIMLHLRLTPFRSSFPLLFCFSLFPSFPPICFFGYSLLFF